jgi:hypothetical protein
MLKRRSYGRRFFSFGSSFFIRFPDDWLRHWERTEANARSLAPRNQRDHSPIRSGGFRILWEIFGEKAEAGYISRVLCRATERIAMIRRRSLSS